MSAPTLRFNPDVQTWPFDGAAREPMTMCEVPRADGSAARFVIPTRLVEALRHFDGERPLAEAAAECAAQAAHEPGAVERLARDFLLPRGILVDPASDAAVEPERRPNRLTYMTFRARLLPARVVYPIAKRLGWLFDPRVAAAMLAVVVVAHLVFYLRLAPGHDALRQVRGEHAALAILVMVASTVLHEFGHAAAAARFGCRRLEIGWGMYYHISVLYTDLSEAWRLPRRQRAVVDVAGMYVQAIFAVGLLGVYAATGSPVPLYAFIATDLAIGASLNPFFRMDGYWLASDLLGVTGLHAEGGKLLRYGALRLMGRREAGPPPALGRAASWMLAAYSAFGLAFFVFAITFALRNLVFGIAVALPHLGAALWSAATASPLAWGALGKAVWALLWRSLILFGTVRFIYTFVTRVAGGIAAALLFAVKIYREWRAAPVAAA